QITGGNAVRSLWGGTLGSRCRKNGCGRLGLGVHVDTSKPTGDGTAEIPQEHRSLAGIYSCWTSLSPDTEIVGEALRSAARTRARCAGQVFHRIEGGANQRPVAAAGRRRRVIRGSVRGVEVLADDL